MFEYLGIIIMFTNLVITSHGAALCPDLRNCKIHGLLNKGELADIFGVNDFNQVPEYEITFPVRTPNREGRLLMERFPSEMTYGIKAFGIPLNLSLRQNEKLISAGLRVMSLFNDHMETINTPIPNCHYDGDVNGLANTKVALSNCDDDLKGTILISNALLHLLPVPKRLRTLLTESGQATPHIVRKVHVNLPGNHFTCTVSNNCEMCQLPFLRSFREARQMTGPKVMKVAVFFDDQAYKRFAPLQFSDSQLRDFLLAFMNQINSIYHHPSLGIGIDIIVIHIEIMHDRPVSLQTFNGNASQLLENFGEYQITKNPSDNMHWDHAVYLTGLDLFTEDIPGVQNHGVTGFGNLQFMCDSRKSISVAEIGITDSYGSPETASGFTSSYIVAHEIGHNLGLLHDGSNGLNSCNVNTFIMSASRSSEGQTSWSSCSQTELINSISQFPCLNQANPGLSAIAAIGLNSIIQSQLPGQIFDADYQCFIFTKDATYRRANPWGEICPSLQCSKGIDWLNHYAGPALQGTFCGEGKWCLNGQCVSWGATLIQIESNPNWSPFQIGNCLSGCIEKAKGSQISSRICNNPKPKNSEKTCIGDETIISLCDDSMICSMRIKVADYATQQCAKYIGINFSGFLMDGIQFKHDPAQVDRACKIWCKAASGIGRINPDTRTLGFQAVFPDGTWCHNDGISDYFCHKHLCKAG